MSESHPSPTGSSSSSLFGGGGGGSSSNTVGVSGSSPYPSPSKPTWAQILNSNANTSSNASASSATTTATTTTAAATTTTTTASTTGNSGGGGGAASNSPSSSSPTSQHSATTTSIGGGGATQTSGTTSTTRSISPSQVTPSTSSAFNLSGTRSGFMPNVYDQQQQSQMNWSLNFNQTSPWMMDDDTQRHSNLAGSSSQQSLDSNHNAPGGGGGGGDGFDRLESSSPTSEWGKPVTSNNSTANGWSNFQQQQQTLNNPSRSNAVGNNNTPSNQWPEMNTFYGTNSSSGSPFTLPQNNNDNMNNNSASTTWQDPSSSGSASDTLTLTTSNSNNSVINKHKSSSSSSSIAASLSGALKSAIALGGANVDLSGGNGDPTVPYIPQPKLVEQLGWDEPDIKVMKRANFDDGTSVWGDPMELISAQVKKWTNGTKAALTNSTNTILQQQPSIVQKPASTNVQSSNSTTSTSQMVLNDENWPKQQSPTLTQQSSSQWNDTTASTEQGTPPVTSQQQTNYRTQQSAPANWNPQSQQGGHHGDDWFRDGMVDTSDWGLQGQQNKAPFDPYEGQVDTSGWGVQGGPGGAMGGPLSMPPMNRNRFMNDYDLNEGAHDPHGMHRIPNYENQSMTDPYRQGSDLKNPIIGLGGLLPPSANQPPHHMLPPSQLPFGPRPGAMYQQGNMLRQTNPNGIPSASGAIMGTGGLISPKLSTTSPVPNQAPYVPLAGKQSNIPTQPSQTPTSQQQQQQQQGTGNANNGAVHAQIMQQFRLAVQAGLITQDLLNTKLPPFMLQLLQKLFELQQKYQSLSVQLSDFSKHKQRFPITFFQTEYERLSKLITQKKQEMLLVQKQIQDAHAKLTQQQSATSNSASSQMMTNGPTAQNQSASGGSSTQSQDQLAERLQHSLSVDQSRLHQWTKQQTSTRGPQSSSSMFGPPGLSQKDWQTGGNNPNENWENTQTNESNNNNQVGNVDPHGHNNQVSAFGDTLSEFVDDTDGPPPFVPGQLWNWKSSSFPNAEDDPHATPTSFTIGPKGPISSMSNLNVGGAESAFSNPQLLHHMQRQQQSSNRSQWQTPLHDQQGFQPSMNDWGKSQQYRGTSKPPQSLNHPPPPHASFGGYRPYM